MYKNLQTTISQHPHAFPQGRLPPRKSIGLHQQPFSCREIAKIASQRCSAASSRCRSSSSADGRKVALGRIGRAWGFMVFPWFFMFSPPKKMRKTCGSPWFSIRNSKGDTQHLDLDKGNRFDIMPKVDFMGKWHMWSSQNHRKWLTSKSQLQDLKMLQDVTLW